MNDKLKPNKFELMGIQRTEEGNYFVRLTLEDGEIKEVLELRGPENKALSVERLKLAVSRLILEVGNS